MHVTASADGSFELDFPVRSHPSWSADVAIHTDSEWNTINLPGWRWATIKQVALDRLSRSLHSDVCDSDGCNDVVVHSKISGRGGWRERAALNNSSSKQSRRSSRLRYLNSAFWRGSFILSSIGWRLLRLSPCYHSSPLSMKLIIPSRPFGYDQV